MPSRSTSVSSRPTRTSGQQRSPRPRPPKWNARRRGTAAGGAARQRARRSHRPGIASPRPAGGRGQDGSPGFPRRPFARSTPNTPESSAAPAPETKTPSMAFAVSPTARLPLSPPNGRDCMTTLTQASLTLETARSHQPRFAPDLSITHGGIATRDPDVSPDRTHTGRPSRTYRSYVIPISSPSSRRSSPGARRHRRSDRALRGAAEILVTRARARRRSRMPEAAGSGGSNRGDRRGSVRPRRFGLDLRGE
jgi:hypothetical protein